MGLGASMGCLELSSLIVLYVGYRVSLLFRLSVYRATSDRGPGTEAINKFI